MSDARQYNKGLLLAMSANVMARFYELRFNTVLESKKTKPVFFGRILSSKLFINEAVRVDVFLAGLRPLNGLLTLPETLKKIEERGYKGINKYLYTGFAEFSKFMFMPAKYFAALHDNFDTFQYEERLKRTQGLKAVVIALSLTTAIAVFVFTPFAAAAIPAVSQAVIPAVSQYFLAAASGAFSVTFFAVIIHAVNNFMEDRRFPVKPCAFDLFSAAELEEKISEAVNQTVDLNKEISVLADKKEMISSLFITPGRYWSGHISKTRMQKLIETYYLKAIEINNPGAQDSLTDLIYAFYKNIDSLDLQEAVIFTVERDWREKIDNKRVEILKFFYALNNAAFAQIYGLSDIVRRINNQKRILKFLFSDSMFSIIEEYGKLPEGIAKEIFLTVASFVSNMHLKQILTEMQYKKLKEAEADNFDIQYLLSDISEMNIANHVGYVYIKALKNAAGLRSLSLNKRLPLSYRLYSLLKLSSMEDSIYSSISRENATENSLAKGAIDIDKALLEYLALKISETGILDGKFEITGDNYLNSMEAEMIFTAAALSLHSQYPGISITGFLKQLEFTFVNGNNTDFVVKYSSSNESEYVRIAMADNKQYAQSIKDFVESIYKRNGNDKTRVTGKNSWLTVSKRPSAIVVGVFG